MKASLFKIVISLAAVALTVPFAAVALAVGARAVEPAAGSSDGLLLVALAVVCAAASVAKNSGRAAGRLVRVSAPGARRRVLTNASSHT